MTLSLLWTIKPSKIHGVGVHVTCFVPRSTIIGKAITVTTMGLPSVTPLGSKVNHSWTPTAELIEHRGKYYLQTCKDLFPDDEVTVDYRHTPWFIEGPNEYWS